MPDTNLVRWQPDRRALPDDRLPVSMLTALRRGLSGNCPACGKGLLFDGWLRVCPVCSVCAAPLGEVRSDDAPPYFTIFIVAHLVIGAEIALESATSLSIAAEMMILLPVTLALCMLLIRPVKGATVGLMMTLGLMKPPDGNEHG